MSYHGIPYAYLAYIVSNNMFTRLMHAASRAGSAENEGYVRSVCSVFYPTDDKNTLGGRMHACVWERERK